MEWKFSISVLGPVSSRGRGGSGGELFLLWFRLLVCFVCVLNAKALEKWLS